MTVMESVKGLVQFVPVNDPVKISLLNLVNESARRSVI